MSIYWQIGVALYGVAATVIVIALWDTIRDYRKIVRKEQREFSEFVRLAGDRETKLRNELRGETPRRDVTSRAAD